MPLTFAETPLYYKDTQGTYHRILSGADMTGYRTASAQDAIDAAQDADIASRAKTDEIGIVITGSRPSMAVSPGQYVIVRESTITGITDGLYINSSGGDLSPSTDVTAADLTKVSNGGLNAVALRVSSKTYANGVVVYRFGSMRAILVGTTYANPICTLDAIDRPPFNVSCYGRVYNGTTYVDCVTYVEVSGTVRVVGLYGGEISGIDLNFLIGRGITYMVNG